MTDRSAKRADIRVERTYEQLIEALIHLLETKTFDDLTVLEICNEANVHRATFYKHFVDKHDFLNTCLKTKLSRLNFEKPQKGFSIESMNENCMKMISKVLDFVEENKAFVTKVSTQHYSSSFTNTLLDAVAAFIIEQIEAKVLPGEMLGYNLPLMANYYSGAIVGLTRWWATSDFSCTREELLNFAQLKVNDLCNFCSSISNH